MARSGSINQKELALLWQQGVPVSVLADYFGSSKSRISQLRKSLGLAGRSRASASEILKFRQKMGLVDAPKPMRCSVALPCVAPPKLAPQWSPERDDDILESGGRYAAVAKLHARWGIPTAQIIARWHRLRVAA